MGMLSVHLFYSSLLHTFPPGPLPLGCEVSGHQWVFLPAFPCPCYPHTQALSPEGPACRYTHQQDTVTTGQGTVPLHAHTHTDTPTRIRTHMHKQFLSYNSATQSRTVKQLWRIELLSVVLKSCCYGSSTENGLFLHLCAARLGFKAELQRGVLQRGSHARCGQDKEGLTASLLTGMFDVTQRHIERERCSSLLQEP